MSVRIRKFDDQVAQAISYLGTNTPITYLEPGSISRALVDATMLEVSRLQDFVAVNYENSFLSTAQGPFLDLFGEMYNIPRVTSSRAKVYKEDQTIRFYVRSGTLGSRLANPSNASQGLIPKGTSITNAAGTVEFVVTEGTVFPVNAKQAYVPAQAAAAGAEANVGVNQLTIHSLSAADVYVTNDLAITTGTDLEPDEQYRFRLSRAFSTRFSSNETAVSVAASTIPGVSRVELVPYARGSGTFDVLVIPQRNRLSKAVKDSALRAVEAVAAYGISPKIREPEYVPFVITARLRFAAGTSEGEKNVARTLAQSAILSYIATIPIGGELVINQLRSAALAPSEQIVDITILELCIDGRARGIRNFTLMEDEILVPSDTEEAIVIV